MHAHILILIIYKHAILSFIFVSRYFYYTCMYQISMLSQINRRENVVIFHLTTLWLFGKKDFLKLDPMIYVQGWNLVALGNIFFSNTTISIIQGISCEFIVVLRVIMLIIFGIRPHSVALIKRIPTIQNWNGSPFMLSERNIKIWYWLCNY